MSEPHYASTGVPELRAFAEEYVHRCPMCNAGDECQDDLCYQARAALGQAPPSTSREPLPARAEAIVKAILRKIHEWRQIGSDPDVLLESRNLHAELADEMEEAFDSAEPISPTALGKSVEGQS